MFIVKVPGINGLGKTKGCERAGNAILESLKEIYSNEEGKIIDVKLLDLEEKYPELRTPESPSQRVGGEPLDEFKKVKHVVRQWSFDDCFDFDELKKWDEKVRRMVEKESSLKGEKIEADFLFREGEIIDKYNIEIV